jgi:ketosteroid isomerase-like protein
MTGQTIRDRSLLVEGDTALMFGTAEPQTAGADAAEIVTTLRCTALCVRRNGSWRMLALQTQPLKQAR